MMFHTNLAELWLLFDTFTRVWSSGGQANLSLQTKDSQTRAQLDLQLGPANGRRPGPPAAGGREGGIPQEQPPHLHPQARRRGPEARARDARRRQEWFAKQQDSAQEQPENQTALEETQPAQLQEQQQEEILLTSDSNFDTD